MERPVKRGIYRKHPSPCPTVVCLDCHNYDPKYEAQRGVLCLAKSFNPREPDRKRVCCWFVPKGQARLVT